MPDKSSPTTIEGLLMQRAANPNDPMLALSKASRITGPLEVMKGEMPVDPAFLRSLGKPVSEVLGMVFKTKSTGGEVPSLLRVSNWNSRTGNVSMHSLNKAGQPFEATPAQIDEMIEKGWLDLQQPAQAAGEGIRRLIGRTLGDLVK